MAINFLTTTNTLPEIQINDTGNNPRLELQESGSVSGGISTTGGALVFEASSGIEKARILSTGQFLIGHTSYYYAGTYLQVGNTSDNQNGLQITTSTTGNGYILFGDGTGANSYIGQIRYNHSNNSMVFNTNGAVAMTINSTGKVGVGHDTLYQKFTVNGNIDIRGGDGSFLTFNNGDANIVINYNGTGRDLSFKTYDGSSNAERMRITKDGKVGIGTTNPVEKLQINSGDVLINNSTISTLKSGGSLYIDLNTFGSYSGRNFRISDNGTSLVNVKQTGEFGIGTTSPAYKLDVDGDVVRIGSSSQQSARLIIQATNTAGAPASTASLLYSGYEQRATGAFHVDSGLSGEEWFSGVPYAASFNNWQVGYDASSGQAEYTANAIITAYHDKSVYINAYGSGTYTGTAATYLAVTSSGKIIETGSGGVLPGGPYLPLAGGTMTGTSGIVFPDSFKLKLGASSDFNVYHSGSHSYLENYTGDIIIQNNADDKDIIFQSDDGSGGTTEYMRIDGGAEYISINKNTVHPDSVATYWGDANDLQIYHDSSNSHVVNLIGNLRIRNFADDSDITFESDNMSGGTTEYFRVDGGAGETIFSRNTQHLDQVYAQFGNSNDLKIYHDGTDSDIINNTGHLLIKNNATNKDVSFYADSQTSGTTEYIRIDGSLGITRFFKNARFSDNIKANFGDGEDLQIYHDGSNSFIRNTNTNLIIKNDYDDGDIIFESDDGSGNIAQYFKIDGGSTLNIFYKPVFVGDGVKFFYGNSSDLQIYHDGSNSYIDETGAGDLYLRSSDNMYFQTYGSGERWITLNENASVDLFYNDVKKFETTSTGVSVTGNMVTSGDVTINGSHLVLANGTTEAQSTDYLYIGGSGLSSADAAIYIGNGGSGDNVGWRLFYKGSGSGNDNKFIIKSENTGSPVDALAFTQDGNATFAGTITTGSDLTIGGTGGIFIPENLYHVSDTNTYIGFPTTDEWRVVTGGTQRLDATNSGVRIGAGVRVTTILDEDTMSSDSATALATQQSIKAYVDSSITGSTTYRGTWDPDVSLNSGYGNPNLNTVTKQDGYYYICSANGSATPNGSGTEPNSWHTGDWVVYNSDLGSSGEWQKIDNTSVLSGTGTGQKVAKWDGSGTSETLADGPITFSSNNSTFAGSITFNGSLNSTGNLILSSTGGANIELYGNGSAYYDGTSHNFRDSDASPTYFVMTSAQVVSYKKLVVSTDADAALTLDQTGTDTGWSYINFNTSGTRNYFIGQDANKNFDIYNDNIDSTAISISFTDNDVTFGNTLIIPNYIAHQNDSNTYFGFSGNDTFQINTNGAERVRVNSSGNVGIGTTTPDNLLDVVVSDVNITPNTESSAVFRRNGNNYISILSNSSNWGGILFGEETDANDGALTYDHPNGNMVFETRDAERMRITSACNVGIGDTAPTNISANTFSLSVNSSRNDLTGALVNKANGTVKHQQYWDSGGYAFILTSSSGDFKWNFGSSEKMRLTETGNLGIGTSSPGYKLDVNGNIRIGSSFAAQKNIYFGDTNWSIRTENDYTSNNLDNLRYAVTDSGFSGHRFTNVNNDELLYIKGDGSGVGIGTITPTYDLSVNGAISGAGFVTYAKSYGSLDTTGNAVAGITTGSNGASCGFTFTCFGGIGKYQRIVYSCYNDSGTWRPKKVIDEGTNDLDVTASADGATITFTFKARSSSQSYTPRVKVEADGQSINSTYA